MGKRMEQQKKTKFDVAFLKAKENIIINQKHVPCKHSPNNSTSNLLVLRDKRASHSIYIIDIDIDCFTSGKNNLCTMLLLVLQFKKIDYVLALGTASSKLICTTSFCLQKIYWLRPMNEKKKNRLGRMAQFENSSGKCKDILLTLPSMYSNFYSF